MSRHQENLDDDQVAERVRLRSPQVYEVVRVEGEDELERPADALVLSGIAAGLAMGSSVCGVAFLSEALEGVKARGALVPLGYTFGFLIVILGRFQLFTENTITAILPLLRAPTWSMLLKTGRLWGLVFGANLVGTFGFALFTVLGGMFGAEGTEAIVEASARILDLEMKDTLLRAIPAGFLVAAIVWMLPSAETSKALVIIVLTYLIGLGHLSHVIAGSAELFVLVLVGRIDLGTAIAHHLVPSLVGNILGGTGLFSLLAHGQVVRELEDGDAG
mgnify:CR=1 FL=1